MVYHTILLWLILAVILGWLWLSAKATSLWTTMLAGASIGQTLTAENHFSPIDKFDTKAKSKSDLILCYIILSHSEYEYGPKHVFAFQSVSLRLCGGLNEFQRGRGTSLSYQRRLYSCWVWSCYCGWLLFCSMIIVVLLWYVVFQSWRCLGVFCLGRFSQKPLGCVWQFLPIRISYHTHRYIYIYLHICTHTHTHIYIYECVCVSIYPQF